MQLNGVCTQQDLDDLVELSRRFAVKGDVGKALERIKIYPDVGREYLWPDVLADLSIVEAHIVALQDSLVDTKITLKLAKEDCRAQQEEIANLQECLKAAASTVVREKEARDKEEKALAELREHLAQHIAIREGL
jgi:hypothetical protein